MNYKICKVVLKETIPVVEVIPGQCRHDMFYISYCKDYNKVRILTVIETEITQYYWTRIDQECNNPLSFEITNKFNSQKEALENELRQNRIVYGADSLLQVAEIIENLKGE